jgi:hypothetical protein
MINRNSKNFFKGHLEYIKICYKKYQDSYGYYENVSYKLLLQFLSN